MTNFTLWLKKIEKNHFDSARPDTPLVFICNDENHFNLIVSEYMRDMVGVNMNNTEFSPRPEVTVVGHVVGGRIGIVNLAYPESNDGS